MTQPAVQGREFLRAVIEARLWDWDAVYARYQAGELSTYEALALAHPMHYESTAGLVADDTTRCRVRGQRRFPSEPRRRGLRCRSDQVWGYECPNVGAAPVADHLFPWAFGGPTLATNLVYLCDVHNRVKGSDFHLYPFFEALPPWLDGVLGRIGQVRAR